MNKQPKNLFIGRWQPAHKSHMYLFDTYLKKNEPILIAIRDIEPDEKNPFTSLEVKNLWEKVYSNEIKSGLVDVIIIPNIKSVNWGRGVGYETNQIDVPNDVAQVSATQIRQNIKEGKDDWKLFVDESIHDDIYRLLKEKQLC